MAGMGYTLVMFTIAMILSTILFIPLNSVFGTLVSTINGVIGAGDYAARNLTAQYVFSFSFMFIVIMLVLWVLKPSIGGES